MTKKATPDASPAVDVRQLARELIAEDLDLDDLFEADSHSETPFEPDTRASAGEPNHRASTVQVHRARTGRPMRDDPDKVVLRRPPFGPMRLPDRVPSSEPSPLPSATPHEPTVVSLPPRRLPSRRRPIGWLLLLVIIMTGTAIIAHHALSPESQQRTP